MARTLFVHVGFHKTGTTSIQVFLRRNAELLAELGVLVPTAGTVFLKSGHHNIAWQLSGDACYRPDVSGLGDLEAELAASALPRAVISSEDFTNLADAPEARARLEAAAARAGYAVRYILFHRAIFDYVPSLYLVIRKLGYTSGYLRYLSQIRRTGRYRSADGHVFYFRVEDFADAFAGADLHIVSYDDVKHDAIGPFLKLIGAGDLQQPVTDETDYNYNRTPALKLAFYRLVGKIVLAGARV
ncbi:MAG: hypothetical protein AB7O39_10925 [Flavobacteriaceae bacterium]